MEATEVTGQEVGVRVTRAPCTLPGRLRPQPTLLVLLAEVTQGPVEEVMEVHPVAEVTEVRQVEDTLEQVVEVVKVVAGEEETYKANYKPWPPWVEQAEDLVEDPGQDVELWVVEPAEVMEEVAEAEDTT